MIYLYGAIIASLGMDVVIKFVSADVDTWTMVAIRWLSASLMLAPFAIARFSGSEWNPVRWVHVFKAMLKVIGTYCLFHALQHPHTCRSQSRYSLPSRCS